MSACCAASDCNEHFLPIGFVLDEMGQRVLPLDVVIRGMSQGTMMYKVKGPKQWYRRKYRIDVQNMRLTYSPSHKPFWKDSDIAIDIYDIEEVRKGWNSDIFHYMDSKFRRSTIRSSMHPNLVAVLKEENCMSIVVNPSRKVVDLIAPNVHTRDAWVRGLEHLIATCKNTHKLYEYDRWLKEQVRKADVNNNGSLNFNECLTLLQQLNLSMDRKDVQKIFDMANFRKNKIDGEDALDADEFVTFYHSLTRRPEVEELMKRNSVSRTTMMGAEELQKFLTTEQKVQCTIEEAKMLIKKYEQLDDQPSEETQPIFLTLNGFQQMLLSVDCNIFNKKHRIIHQDMTLPLNYYYIATSHNTYLLSGQLIGSSSVEGYIEALNRGCRCLELDTWDGPDGEPIVFHGYTLTSRIFLKDILVAIREYAFRTSQYPIILSLENHCSIPYQLQMAEHFENILGDYLYTKPVDPSETQFPSPEDLARKILIKAKTMKDVSSSNAQEVDLLEEEVEQEEMMASMPREKQDLPIQEAPRLVGNIAPELSDLVNYFRAVRFTDFEDTHNWKFQDMSSFQETNGLRYCAEEGFEFVNYNKRHFSRIYPKGTRTDSSNYDPFPFWNVGCQLVALNYQTFDKSMMLNEAKFAENGNCGYVLKPKCLYDKDISYDPSQEPDPILTRHLHIKVISGQHIPKPNRATSGEVVDPYVVIKVAGHQSDVQKKKTNYIKNNGFNPSWNETFVITLKMPGLAIITFTVKDYNLAGKNEVLGWYSLPYTALTEGYRHVHLTDLNGRPLVPSSLFIHVSNSSSQSSATTNKSYSIFSKKK